MSEAVHRSVSCSRGASRALPRLVGRAVGVLACVMVAGAIGVAEAAGGAGTAASNRAAAEVDAPGLLALLQLPAGAQRSAGEPVGDAGLLGRAADAPGGRNLIDAPAWFLVPGTAESVLSYVRSHVPPGAPAPSDLPVLGTPARGTVAFNFPAVAGVLVDRALDVQAVQISPTETAVRADGRSVWLIPRPRSDRIPAGATAVEYTTTAPGVQSPTRMITSPAAIRRLVGSINQLSAFQPIYCTPQRESYQLSLRFLSVSGRVLARATERRTHCPTVSLRVDGHDGPTLSDSPTLTYELEQTGAIRTCRASQLHAFATRPQFDSLPGDENGADDRFVFADISPAPCSLHGVADLGLLGIHGRPLSSGIDGELVGTVGAHPQFVPALLGPGGTAAFDADWTRCPPAAHIATVIMKLPGVRGQLAVHVGTRRRPFAPCGGNLTIGTLSTSP